MTAQEILTIYHKTQFMFHDEHDQPVYFHVGDTPIAPALKKKQFAIITAWNPLNKTLTLEENRLSNNELQQLLTNHGYTYYPSTGTIGDHTEESYTIENISEEEAIQLGRKFDQYAILYNDPTGPRFIFLTE